MSTIIASLVHCDSDILGGIPVFVGTRVPAQTLIDYLSQGYPLQEFLDDFPTVKTEQVHGLLEAMKSLILSDADETITG